MASIFLPFQILTVNAEQSSFEILNNPYCKEPLPDHMKYVFLGNVTYSTEDKLLDNYNKKDVTIKFNNVEFALERFDKEKVPKDYVEGYILITQNKSSVYDKIVVEHGYLECNIPQKYSPLKDNNLIQGFHEQCEFKNVFLKGYTLGNPIQPTPAEKFELAIMSDNYQSVSESYKNYSATQPVIQGILELGDKSLSINNISAKVSCIVP